MNERRYHAAIARGLDAALLRASKRRWDADSERVVVFSDLHRGQGDHADDFRRCASTYGRALEFYLDRNYRLVTLGDAEELWEGWPGKVVPTYRALLELEARFDAEGGGGLAKIWGNHDDLWQYPAQVERHLAAVFGELQVTEGLLVTVTRGNGELGRIFLVHGHQGTGSSDRWGGVSRHFVRWVWRPIQRLFKVSLNTPATDFEIRGKHDRAMYEWAAARNDLVLIAGHTHNPVFVSRPHVETLERVHRQAADGDDPAGTESLLQAEAELAWARRESGGEPAPTAREKSCYFNSGCCCFSNGDITGIEIADGEIRLVRWARDVDDPAARIIEARGLATVLAELGRS